MEIANIQKYLLLPLAKLKTAEWNYKQNNEELNVKLLANIQRNGQVENLLVRELEGGNYEVVNGNHRRDALEKLGCKHAVCYNLGKITDDEAYRISIETNETKFAVDQVQLARLIKSVVDSIPMEELLLSFPYSEQEVDAYIKMSSFEWDALERESDSNDILSNNADGTLQLNIILNETDAVLWHKWKAQCASSNPEVEVSDSFVLVSALRATE